MTAASRDVWDGRTSCWPPAQGLGACPTSWASYGGERLLRGAVGVPDDWMLAGHVVVG
jgi:hypothetical protein